MILLTRKAEFSSAHYYWNDAWSPEVDLKELKDILEREVVGVYDHRHLNLEVPEFASTIPTTENIAIAIWRRLNGKIPNATLHRVRIYEMPDLFADYYGEE
jgi:6-pyruvoyltetrahydropterin/6-carboxytetrahydropterin synthase